jgi:hypothetical protein
MNEARPEVCDAASAKLAWDRTLKFLKRALPLRCIALVGI